MLNEWETIKHLDLETLIVQQQVGKCNFQYFSPKKHDKKFIALKSNMEKFAVILTLVLLAETELAVQSFECLSLD